MIHTVQIHTVFKEDNLKRGRDVAQAEFKVSLPVSFSNRTNVSSCVRMCVGMRMCMPTHLYTCICVCARLCAFAAISIAFNQQVLFTIFNSVCSDFSFNIFLFIN